MSFTRYLEDPEMGARYRKIKRWFYLTESVYDVTSECQLRCDGCFYFTGDKYKVRDVTEYDRWRPFMETEKERGINFVHLAGAEPSLVPDVLRACHDVIPHGSIFTNGLARIDPEISYRIHISVWGDAAHDPIYRRNKGGKLGPDCLPIQLRNYADDPRAIFIYTFHRDNIDQVDEVIDRVASAGHQITFNVFSAAVKSKSGLRTGGELSRTRDKMLEVTERHPGTVVWSRYSTEVHAAPTSLFAQFGCPLPRASGVRDHGVNKTFRCYRADLTHAIETDCGVPDIDCDDCRHYAAGSLIVTARLNEHTATEELFRGWLDYVDTWLAVWIAEYQQDPPLLPA